MEGQFEKKTLGLIITRNLFSNYIKYIEVFLRKKARCYIIRFLEIRSTGDLYD